MILTYLEALNPYITSVFSVTLPPATVQRNSRGNTKMSVFQGIIGFSGELEGDANLGSSSECKCDDRQRYFSSVFRVCRLAALLGPKRSIFRRVRTPSRKDSTANSVYGERSG